MTEIRVALVSCVKSKREVESPAEDLYTSALFKSMRRYAELNSDEWFILSAEHGVLRRDAVVAPYERSLNQMSKPEREQWAASVRRQLLGLIPAGAAVSVLAGERYRENVVPFLKSHGFLVDIPMQGLKLGHQLRWLKERTAK